MILSEQAMKALRRLFRRKAHKHNWELLEVSERGMRLVEVCSDHLIPQARETINPRHRALRQAVEKQIAKDAKETER